MTGSNDNSFALFSSPLPSLTEAGSRDDDDRATSLDIAMGYATTAGDVERHPKGKRKRTAARDKSILEASYQTNPKPDKAARRELVQRVSLNEKEVQIWFQNRRQNDRRKSRPLSPQEIAAIRNGGMQILSSDSISHSPQSTGKASPRPMHSVATKDGSPDQRAWSDRRSLFPINRRDEHGVHIRSSLPAATNAASKVSIDSMTPNPGSQPDPLPLTRSSSSLVTAWSPPSFSHSVSDPGHTEALCRSGPPPSSPPTAYDLHAITPGLRRSQSCIRLALSLEGKAEVVANDRSPPRSRDSTVVSNVSPSYPNRDLSTRRRDSDVSQVTLPPISVLTDTLLPGLGRGRSRNAQAWELCCDSDKRDELTAQAENESNGSAVAAINLLRSTAAVLQPNPAKRNAPPLKTLEGAQYTKKPRLQRASSSGGKENEPGTCLQPSLTSLIFSSTLGDSDKENWSSGEDGGSRHPDAVSRGLDREPLVPEATSRRATDKRRRGRALGGQDYSATFQVNSRAQIKQGCHNSGSKSKAEMDKFMGGDVSPSKKGDMDCIAGLLSLSQGNWR